MSVSTARSLPNCDVLPVGRPVEVAVLLSPSRASAKLVLPVTVAAPVVGRTPGRCRPRTQPRAPSPAA